MRSWIAALAVAGLFTVGCASKKVSLDEPEPLDKTLNSRTSDRSEQVGVRGDNIVVQKKMYLEEELNGLQSKIRDLENDVYGESVRDPGGLYLRLQTCRRRMADPRIGGTGTSEPMEPWEKPSETDVDFDYRVDKKKNVVAVTEEELGQRLANLKKTKRVMDQRYQEFQRKAENCEQKYKIALVNHGLNPDDTEAQGEWVEGPNGYRVWKMRRPKTNDPEEMMRRKQEREKKAQN
jgi:hypothetical protein